MSASVVNLTVGGGEPEMTAVICAAIRPFDDGIARVPALSLGEWLGMERPRDIRQRAEENRLELERYGNLRTTHANSEDRGRGRPSTEYWLTEEQALLLCMFSRTQRAADVREALIKAFMMLRRGELSTMPRLDIRAIEIAADRIVAPLLAEQRKFHSEVLERMDSTDRRVDRLSADVVEIGRKVDVMAQIKRRDPSPKDVTALAVVVRFRYGGLCPCCEEVQIVDDAGAKTEQFSVDHWFGRADGRVASIWPLCIRCNSALYSQPEFKRLHVDDFKQFHKRRTLCGPEQMRLAM